MEDVTGQSIQTAGEYVSTNVLSFPFHGACVDGVKYFDTYLNGTAIPDNLLRGSIQEEGRTNYLLKSRTMESPTWANVASTNVAATIAAPNGIIEGTKVVPSVGSNSAYTSQSITTSASAYCASIYARASGF